MENTNVKASVIMPVYNSGIYLKTAVDSILNQSLKEIELILVDDGSTDGSSEKCDEYARKDSRVVVIHQKNGGICNARNTAIKIARGEYIAFSDHDDEYLPGLLENVYKRAIDRESDIVKFGKKEFIIYDEKVVRTRTTHLSEKDYTIDEIRENYLIFLNGMILDCVWDALFKRSVLVENGILFDERYKAGGEDIDFISRFFIHTSVFSTISECYYFHYIRKGFSTSAKYNPLKVETAKMLAERITKSLNEIGVDISKFKTNYAYQMMFTYFNGIASLLQNPLCTLSIKEKTDILDSLRSSVFLPNWIFKVSFRDMWKKDKKYALSYFLYKNKFYRALLLLATIRLKQVEYKKYL